jgi:hypothetical protein
MGYGVGAQALAGAQAGGACGQRAVRLCDCEAWPIARLSDLANSRECSSTATRSASLPPGRSI